MIFEFLGFRKRTSTESILFSLLLSLGKAQEAIQMLLMKMRRKLMMKIPHPAMAFCHNLLPPLSSKRGSETMMVILQTTQLRRS